MIEQNEIDEKLLAYLLDELDDVEREEVKAWLEESEGNKEYFREFQRVYLEFQWGVYAREVKSDFNLLRKKLRKRSSLQVWYGVAAAVVILLSVGGILLWNSGEIEEKPVQVAKKVTIQPGKSQAILVLSSGEEVAMGNVSRQLEEKDGTSVVVSETGRISYQSAEGKGGTTKDTARVMNRLVIPRGGEFNLTLSDGTRVWLNAETELRYPVQFNGKERVVYLKGEAYFDVASDKEHPFIVKTDYFETAVLGTKFNVRSYSKIDAHVTLLEGKVTVTNDKTESLILEPGEQVTLSENGKLEKQVVDTYPYLEWQKGYFYFDNVSLIEIMQELGRWYNVDVVFENDEMIDYKMHFVASRTESLMYAIRNLNALGIFYVTLDGNRIIIQ